MKKYERLNGLRFTSPGHYEATVSHRGRRITGTITDMTYIDAYLADRRGWKSAGNAIVSQVVQQNQKRI